MELQLDNLLNLDLSRECDFGVSLLGGECAVSPPQRIVRPIVAGRVGLPTGARPDLASRRAWLASIRALKDQAMESAEARWRP